MAGGQERVLRRRIKSVEATRKITKAMELIAASQIQRAQARIIANRPYREGMAKVIVEAAKGDAHAAGKMLGTPEKIETAVIVVIVGDRGLSGAYNSSALRAAERLIIELKKKGANSRVIVVGKKAGPYFRFRGQEVEASFQGFTDRPSFADAREAHGLLKSWWVRWYCVPRNYPHRLPSALQTRASGAANLLLLRSSV